MNIRFTLIPAIALATGAILVSSGCAAAPSARSLPPQGGAEVVLESEFDLGQFSAELAAAVAVQNGEAFGSEVDVVVEPTDSVTLVSQLDDEATPEEIDDAAESFEDALARPADAEFTEQTESLESARDAIATADLTVESTRVSVAGASVVNSANGTAEVTVGLHIVRSLSSGIDWEELIPYVTTVDSATGAVLVLEVHDDTWYAEHPPVETDPALEPEAEVANYSLASADSADTVEVSAAFAVLTSTQRNTVARYALQYYSAYNPAYIPSPQDCTNFASQALFAGGWTNVSGPYNSNSAWWYTGNALIPKSYTWASAQNFYNFAIGSGRATRLSSVYSLRLGNILQLDYGTTGMDHTMIVTAVVNGEPYLTYHAANTVNKPFSAVSAKVHADHPGQLVTWYALST